MTRVLLGFLRLPSRAALWLVFLGPPHPLLSTSVSTRPRTEIADRLLRAGPARLCSGAGSGASATAAWRLRPGTGTATETVHPGAGEAPGPLPAQPGGGRQCLRRGEHLDRQHPAAEPPPAAHPISTPGLRRRPPAAIGRGAWRAGPDRTCAAARTCAPGGAARPERIGDPTHRAEPDAGRLPEQRRGARKVASRMAGARRRGPGPREDGRHGEPPVLEAGLPRDVQASPVGLVEPDEAQELEPDGEMVQRRELLEPAPAGIRSGSASSHLTHPFSEPG